MGEYICIRKCFYKEKLYAVGDVYNSEPGEEMPRHFKALTVYHEETGTPPTDPDSIMPDFQAMTKPQLIGEADKLGFALDMTERKETMVESCKAAWTSNRDRINGQ
jgi:hypothetical protein